MGSAQSKSASISIHHVQPADSKSADPVIESQPPETLENQAILEESIQGGDVDGEVEEEEEEGDGEVEEEEEEGECGFCLFMKGGGCKDAFVEFEKCVEEGEELSQDKCDQLREALWKCMKLHPGYYASLLQAEEAAEAEAARQLEEEKEGN